MYNLTIDDIHRIREDNYQKTKNMSSEDILKQTKDDSRQVLSRLKSIKIINDERETSVNYTIR